MIESWQTKKNRLSVFARACAFVMLGVGCSQVTYLPFDPVQRTHIEGDHEAADRAIRRALAGRGWLLESREENTYLASLSIRTHKVWVKIERVDAQVVVSYVRSENMGYSEKNGKPIINRRYNTWIKNLITDINKEMVQ